MSNKPKKEEIEKIGDKLIKYLLNLLENYIDDVRGEYLYKNPFTEFKV